MHNEADKTVDTKDDNNPVEVQNFGVWSNV